MELIPRTSLKDETGPSDRSSRKLSSPSRSSPISEIVGLVTSSDDHQPRRSLSAALIQEGILSREDVEGALAAESKTGETLAEFVLRTRPTEEEKVGRLLAQEWGLPFVAAAELRVDPRAVERLPLTLARDLEALPIGFSGDTLVVAVVQPRRPLFDRILDELGETSFVVVPCSVLESLLAQLGAASANGDMPATMPTEPLETRDAVPSAVRDLAQAGPVQLGPRPATGNGIATPVQPFGATAALQGELRGAREQMTGLGEEPTRLRAAESELQAGRGQVTVLGEELARLRGVESELQAAGEKLARVEELQAELRSAREELGRLGDVQGDLEAARHELVRLGAVEGELRIARAELTRLPEVETELHTAREGLARLEELQAELGRAGEELGRLGGVEGELHAAREELARLGDVQGDLEAARHELVRLGAVEGELRSAREELTRLHEAEVALRISQEELARLQEELDARDAELEVGKRRYERDAETIHGLERELSERDSSAKRLTMKHSKAKHSKPTKAKSKDAKSKKAKAKR